MNKDRRLLIVLYRWFPSILQGAQGPPSHGRHDIRVLTASSSRVPIICRHTWRMLGRVCAEIKQCPRRRPAQKRPHLHRRRRGPPSTYGVKICNDLLERLQESNFAVAPADGTWPGVPAQSSRRKGIAPLRPHGWVEDRRLLLCPAVTMVSSAYRSNWIIRKVPPDPQLERIVQEEIRQERTDHPLFVGCLLSVRGGFRQAARRAHAANRSPNSRQLQRSLPLGAS
jgi:hypothetical protein